MISAIAVFSLFFSSQSLFASACHTPIETLQKKIITDHIYKFPLSFGKDIEVQKIETVSCLNQGISRYNVIYTDIVCYDLNDPERELLKCHRVRCHSPATVNSAGVVDFELAPSKSCEKIK